jgi:hypothetical protein
MRGPTVALLLVHSKRLGFPAAEEPATGSMIEPSGRISPALINRVPCADRVLVLGGAFPRLDANDRREADLRRCMGPPCAEGNPERNRGHTLETVRREDTVQ